MKTKAIHSYRTLIAAAATTLLMALPAGALPYTWDTGTGDGTTITEGGGTWQVGVGNWNDTGADVVWADGNEAVFGGGTLGNADTTVSGPVVLGGDVAPSLLTFNPPAAGTYTIDLASSTLATPNTFSAVNLFGGTSATILATGSGDFDTSFTGGGWNFNLTGSLTIDAPVSGSGKVFTAGAGNLTLTNDANDFAGLFGKQNGGLLSFSSVGDIGTSSAAGAGNELAVGFNAGLAYTGSGASTDRTLRLFGNNGSLYSNGSGALVLTGAVNNTMNANQTFFLRGSNTGDNEIQGVLADNGANVLNVAKNDGGKWILSGDNTYTGKTSINTGILQINHDNALGDFASTTATTTVANNAKLYLDGSVGDLTIAENITIGSGSGVINNRGGNNTITGAVTLSNGADLRRSAGTLTFSGGINSATNQSISFNLPTTVDTTPIDLNAGLLIITSNGNNPANASELNVAGNDWDLMRINFGGYLTLGAADVLPADSDIEFGWHTQGSSQGTLDLNGFDQTVASIGISLANPAFYGLGGDQNITGGGTLTVNQSAASKEYQGRITDGATATALMKDGPGTLILNNLSGTPSSYSGPTTVNDGVLQAGANNTFSSASAVTVASGAFLVLDGNSVCLGSLAGDGTVENTGPVEATLLSDNFESGSVTLAGVRMYESYINGGWRARQSTGAGGSEWTIADGQIGNASTSTGTYSSTTDPYYRAEGALVQMITNSADGASLTLEFDYDVAPGDTLYAHLWGYTGVAGEAGTRIGNNETGNGSYGNEESEVIGAAGTSLDAYNLKDGADTGFGGAATAISGPLTGSGTYSITVDIGALGIPGAPGLAGLSHLSLAFAKNEDGTAGTTSIDNVSLTTSQTTLATGGDDTDTTFSGLLWDGTTGTLGLLKKGAGTQTLNSAATYTGLTHISAGTLQIGNGGTTGSLSTASAIGISADGTLCFNRSDTVTQGVDFTADPIAGTGTFAVKGGGTVVLTNNATFADGATVSVEAGSTLQLDFAGTDTIDRLFLDGVQVDAGVYDSTDPSGLITGTGSLTVISGPPAATVPNIVDIAIDGSGNVILTLDGSEAGLTAQQSDDLTDGSFVDVASTSGTSTLTIDSADVDPNADGDDYYRVRN